MSSNSKISNLASFHLSSSSKDYDLSSSDMDLNNVIQATEEELAQGPCPSIPCRPSILNGPAYCQEVFNGSSVRFSEVYRMDKCTVLNFVDILAPYLEYSIHNSAREKVMMFLFIVGNHASNRLAQRNFSLREKQSAATTALYYLSCRKSHRTSSVGQAQTLLFSFRFHLIWNIAPGLKSSSVQFQEITSQWFSWPIEKLCTKVKVKPSVRMF